MQFIEVIELFQPPNHSCRSRKLTKIEFLDFSLFGLVDQAAHDLSPKEKAGQVKANPKGKAQNDGFYYGFSPIKTELVICLTYLINIP